MRVVGDTSIWIEYFRGKDPFFSTLSLNLERTQVLGLECVFGELLQGATGKQERKMVLSCWEGLPKIPSEGLWLEAGEFSAIHRLPSRGIGLIDAAIAIATLKSNSLLWTLDKKLASLLPQKHLFQV